MTDPHVLLAGGAGFVGSWTARAFLAAGWRVTVVDPAVAAGRVPERCRRVAEIARGDILDELLAGDRPRTVIGLGAFGSGGRGLLAAARAHPGAAIAVNAGGLATVLDAAARAGVRRVLWTSSTVVYARTAGERGPPADEREPTGPDTAYGLSKQLAEATAAWFRVHRPVDPTGVRLPLVLGPGLRYRGAAAPFRDAMRTFAATGAMPAAAAADSPNDVLYVKDAARLLVALAAFPGNLAPIYNAPSFPLRWSEFVDRLAAATGRPAGGPGRAAVDTVPGWRRLSDAALRAETRFVPAFDPDAMISDWLGEAGGEARGA